MGNFEVDLIFVVCVETKAVLYFHVCLSKSRKGRYCFLVTIFLTVNSKNNS